MCPGATLRAIYRAPLPLAAVPFALAIATAPLALAAAAIALALAAAPPPTTTVVLTLTASGSGSDYSSSLQSELQQKIAAAAGVDKSFDTISVAAASVIITANIAVPASSAAITVQASLASTLGTAAAASTALGVTVEAVPTVTIASPPLPPGLPPPGLPRTTMATESGLDTGIIAALVVSSLAGVGCASVALYLGCIRAKRLESKA